MRVRIIDIAPFLDGTDRSGVAARVDEACREIGFFVITGHGVEPDLLQATREVAMEFFRRPVEQKLGVGDSSFMGYSPFKGERLAYSLGEETPPDLKEGFTIAQPDVTDDPYFTHPEALQVFPPTSFPSDAPVLEDVSIAFYRRMPPLADAVLEIFAVALDLPQTYFAPFADKPFSFLRYVYYPALDEVPLPGQLRAGAHSDYGDFTIVNFDSAP